MWLTQEKTHCLQRLPVKTDQSDPHSYSPGGQAHLLTELSVSFYSELAAMVTRHFEKASSMQETKTTEEN